MAKGRELAIIFDFHNILLNLKKLYLPHSMIEKHGQKVTYHFIKN